MSKALQKTSKKLIEKCNSFDELEMKHQSIVELLNEQKEYFTRREREFQESHQCKIINGKI